MPLCQNCRDIGADAAANAQKAFAAGDDAGTAAPVEAGLAAILALRKQIRPTASSKSAAP